MLIQSNRISKILPELHFDKDGHLNLHFYNQVVHKTNIYTYDKVKKTLLLNDYHKIKWEKFMFKITI